MASGIACTVIHSLYRDLPDGGVRPKRGAHGNADEAAQYSGLHPRLHRSGEDGPTHQPIEQLTALRATPNMSVWRPATTWNQQWRGRQRQSATPGRRHWCFPTGIPHQPEMQSSFNISRGAYVLQDCDGKPDADCDCDRLRGADLCGGGLQVAVGRCCGAAGVDAERRCFRSPGSGPSSRAAALGAIALRLKPPRWITAQVGRDGWPDHRHAQFRRFRPGGVLMEHFGFTAEAVVVAAKGRVLSDQPRE